MTMRSRVGSEACHAVKQQSLTQAKGGRDTNRLIDLMG